MEYVTLNNGVQMPKIGFGTYKSTDGSDECVISQAMEIGYRSIDTAQAYGNEAGGGVRWKKAVCTGKNCFLPQKFGSAMPVMKKPKRPLRLRWKRCAPIILICC